MLCYLVVFVVVDVVCVLDVVERISSVNVD